MVSSNLQPLLENGRLMRLLGSKNLFATLKRKLLRRPWLGVRRPWLPREVGGKNTCPNKSLPKKRLALRTGFSHFSHCHPSSKATITSSESSPWLARQFRPAFRPLLVFLAPFCPLLFLAPFRPCLLFSNAANSILAA